MQLDGADSPIAVHGHEPRRRGQMQAAVPPGLAEPPLARVVVERRSPLLPGDLDHLRHQVRMLSQGGDCDGSPPPLRI